LTVWQYALGAVSGGLVGFMLGVVGGGGSILAVPLMVYLVGVPNPHIAIGTSALAVAANAAFGLANHWHARNVEWRCGAMFAGAGIFGAFVGSSLGKAVDGQRLLVLFALVMLVVGVTMLIRRDSVGIEGAHCNRENAPKVLSFGGLTGLFSGFFGIGGGFLIVPGLMASTQMPILRAVGTSLVAVTAFGLTTALNYAFSGFIDWPLAAIFIAGGLIGSVLGAMSAKRLDATKGLLNALFAGLVITIAIYMFFRGLT
jgi:uncharacterized protein